MVIVALIGCGCLIFSKLWINPATSNQVQDTAYKTASSVKTPDVVISKANLHKSDVPLPDKDMVEKVQAELFKGVKKEDLEKAKKTVHELHMYCPVLFMKQKTGLKSTATQIVRDGSSGRKPAQSKSPAIRKRCIMKRMAIGIYNDLKKLKRLSLIKQPSLTILLKLKN